MKKNSNNEKNINSSLNKAMCIIRCLATAPKEGMRILDIANANNFTASSIHRLLGNLIEENFVEQIIGTKRYRLSLDFFLLAASAVHGDNLLQIAHPALLRLSAMLNDTVFLMVRHKFDAICLDRIDGSFPIRSFTSEIGGRVPLGIGQGSLAILAFLPKEEQEAIIQFNMPRILDLTNMDEIDMRKAINLVYEKGFAFFNFQLISGMAGLAVPILNNNNYPVAALSVGTLIDRLSDERSVIMKDLLQKEATLIGKRLNPFDNTLRNPMQSLRLN
ncbi:DNA-binding transcriptional regulator, IclR family [Bartonella apihabitans]|uniref:IclR family transcriptional regulator n=1 Tax=Bartonella apihabitans TaxID=2750929 RepID=UPI0009C38082|nr:DNA-binding transcriptional regulator, IclR family [Bartonella apihabitans]